MFQVGALSKDYDVYVPDLLFFGGSMSPASDRSPAFQAECITAALRLLGVERCAVVGFSYGGFVAFRMAEAHPSLVRSVVATGTLAAMTRSTSAAMLRRLGVASWAEVLLPHDVAGVRSLFAAGTHRKWWLPPDRILSVTTSTWQLGERATLRSISKAGHLAQLEFLRRSEAAGAYDDDVNVNVNGVQLSACMCQGKTVASSV
ncbi:hypothetical protein QOZ80_6BG0487370 [Eleusine coracana subsp. coracana]|nr:hypothetical protein QOZ80_6BG0487370 [Eleusine coracana subsp. coracana]